MTIAMRKRSRLSFSMHLSGEMISTLYVIFCFVILNIQIYSPLIPPIIAGVTGLYLAMFHRQFLFFVVNNKTVILYPLVVMLSAIVSDVPSVSAYYGFQLCLTITIGVLLGVCATQHQLIRGIFIATAIVTLVSIISGRTGPSAVGPVLIGLTGSKDAMGFVAMTLATSGMSVLFDSSQSIFSRLSALLLAPLGAYIATHVEAATPMIATLCFPLAFFGFMSLRYLSRFGRGALAVFGVTVAFPFLLMGFATFFSASDTVDRILQSLSKDSTLTGRTIIWEKADEWIAEAPVFGHGYRSFWLGNSYDSLVLLRRFGVSDGRAFQFHHTVREILVDTGWVGLIALTCVAVVFLYYVLASVFLYPNAGSAFIASTYLLLLARTPLETIILVFYPYTALFYACGTASIVFYLSRARARKAAARLDQPPE